MKDPDTTPPDFKRGLVCPVEPHSPADLPMGAGGPYWDLE